MFEEPELHIVEVPADDDYQVERKRQRAESRRRYRDRLADLLTTLDVASANDAERADTILDHLFLSRRREGDGECPCSCHPRLPASDFHDYGFSCSCQLTAEQREARRAQWIARMDAYWGGPEGRAQRAAHAAEEDELIAWLAGNPDVVVTSYGGVAPEQWRGSVGGHSFYFRERHGQWRIELDLRPSGHFSRVWVGGALDDEGSFESREHEEGDIIAEGVIDDPGYGERPAERVEFVADIIRTHLNRQGCTVHTEERDDLELLFGRPLDWCPACGLRLKP